MSCNLKAILPSDIILGSDDLVLHQISLQDILLIRKYRNHENPAKETCRPLVHRNDREYEEYASNMINSGTTFLFGIYTKQENGNEKIIGQISISDYNSRNQSVEAGYLLIQEYRKNGYMKLAMEKMCAFLFTETPINKIYAQTGEFNGSSIKLLDSLHFSCDACLRQHHELDGILYDDCIYSLIKSDWEKMNLS